MYVLLFETGQRLELYGSRGLSVGRATTCDCVLVHESVSSDHATVTPRTDGLWELADRESANGTFVFGERLRASDVFVLVPSATLRFGNLTARVLVEVAVDPKTAPTAEMAFEIADALIAAQSDVASMPNIWAISGRDRGKRLPLSADAMISIGRDPAAAFVLQSEGVSAIHAEVQFRDSLVYVHDAGSRYGTTLEGARLATGEWKLWSHAGVLRLAKTEVLVLVSAEPARAEIGGPFREKVELAQKQSEAEHAAAAAPIPKHAADTNADAVRLISAEARSDEPYRNATFAVPPRAARSARTRNKWTRARPWWIALFSLILVVAAGALLWLLSN
jgi:pSer/pThr/pTyr-binding forkhead associated (FHA) protein